VPGVGFCALDYNKNRTEFDKCVKVVNKKKPVVTSEAKIKSENEKLKKFIAEKLAMYENEWKDSKNFKHMSPDMALPSEAIK